ncbi:MAG: tetratricopeptide repeat protein [Planctomycetes bacterium]|nr:tetratricopeptide repeat protein [Planctomycetota bacterium]
MPEPIDHPRPALPGPRHALLLIGLALVVLLPSAWHAAFLNFDDPRFVGPDSELMQAGLPGILDPTRTIAEAFLPVSNLSLWLDQSALGGSSRVVHLHALLLHVLAALALARLAGRLGLRAWTAAAVGAALLVHPALVESALWASGRKDLLSGLFAILALSVVAARARGRLRGRTASWGTAALALLACYAKGSALVVAPLALVVTWLLRPVDGRRDWRPALWATVVCALATAHHAALAAAAGTMDAPAGGSLAARLAQVPGAFLHFATTALWPAHLDVLYPEVRTLETFVARLAPGLAVLALWLAAIVVTARRGPRLCAAGLAAFGLALAPFNTALPATSLAAADRYLYLAIPGLALAVAAVPRIGPWLLAAGLVPLAWLADQRAQVFRDSGALWEASLARDPDNAVACVNLAADCLQRADDARARATTLRVRAQELLRVAAARSAAAVGAPADRPDERAKGLLADALVAERAATALVEQADELLARGEACARYPQHRWRAADVRVALAERAGRIADAAELAVRAAAAIDAVGARSDATEPRVLAHLNAARLLRQCGRADDSLRQLEAAERLAPDAPLVLTFRAAAVHAAIVAAGGLPVAVDDPRVRQADALLDRAELALGAVGASGAARATALWSAYEVHWTRGVLAVATGRLLLAEKEYRAAIACNPSRAEAHKARVDMYLAQPGMADVAEQRARDALECGVRDPGLRFRLATALFQQGRFDEAREDYEAYLRLRPDDSDARVDLAQVLAAIGYQRLYQLPPAELGELGERVLELDPTQPKGFVMKAVAARGERPPRLLEALVLLEKAREQLPDDPDVAQLYAETLRDRGWQLKLTGGREEVAYDMFRRFLDVAPRGVPTDAVLQAVQQRWRTLLQEAQQHLLAGQLDDAELRLRRCLALLPDVASPNLQLGMVLMQRGSEHLDAALECFRAAADGQRTRQLDPSLAVFYQLRVLAMLGRLDDADALGRDYLASPAAGADPEVLARIRDWLDR